MATCQYCEENMAHTFIENRACCWNCERRNGHDAKRKADEFIADKARKGEKYNKGDWDNKFKSLLKTDDQLRIDALEAHVSALDRMVSELRERKSDKWFLKKPKSTGIVLKFN